MGLQIRISVYFQILTPLLLLIHYSTPQNPELSPHPVLIILSYDGFRQNYLDRIQTPHLHSIAESGISAKMTAQFPTKTFPNHQSIATGLYPESHGVVDNSVYDPKFGKMLRGGDEEFWVYDDGVVPIWILNEWAGPTHSSGVSMWPGSQFPYGPNKTHPTHFQKYNTTIPFESRIDQLISWIINDKVNLICAYFEEPDSTAHAFGPESKQMDLVVQKMDNLTGYLIGKLRELGIYDEVNLVVLSDHGFSEVDAGNMINVGGLVVGEGVEYSVYGSSPVYNVAPKDPAQVDIVYNSFKELSRTKNFTVYKKSELDSLQPNWHYSNNRRIQPIVLVADEGYVFEDFQKEYVEFYEKPPWLHKFNSNTSKYGVHGYDNALISSQPFFMAHGPAFANSGQTSASFANIDLFRLFCKISGFGAPGNNGSNAAIKLLLAENSEGALGFLASAVGGVEFMIVGGAAILGVLLLVLVLVLVRQRRHRRGTSGSTFSSGAGHGHGHEVEQGEQSL